MIPDNKYKSEQENYLLYFNFKAQNIELTKVIKIPATRSDHLLTSYPSGTETIKNTTNDSVPCWVNNILA